MWRRTERANLEKKPSTRLSQEPCLGVKVNSSGRSELVPRSRYRRSGRQRMPLRILCSRSKRTAWYSGCHLLEHLEMVDVGDDRAGRPFRTPVQLARK
jgi:hypothetical protein